MASRIVSHISDWVRFLAAHLLSFPEILLPLKAREYLSLESRGIQRFVLRFLPPSARDCKSGTSLLLDAGAGSRKWKNLVEMRGHVYQSCDIKQNYAQDDLTRNGTFYFGEHEFIASVESLPMQDGIYDYILSTQVLEHVQDPGQAIKEMTRVLKPGGSLVLTTNFMYGLHGAPFDFFRFTKNGLKVLANEAGLVVDHLSLRGGYFGHIAQFFFDIPSDFISKVSFGTTTPNAELVAQIPNSGKRSKWALALPVFYVIKLVSWSLSFAFQILDSFSHSEKYPIGLGMVAHRPN